MIFSQLCRLMCGGSPTFPSDHESRGLALFFGAWQNTGEALKARSKTPGKSRRPSAHLAAKQFSIELDEGAAMLK
jgi:hypothetical protein